MYIHIHMAMKVLINGKTYETQEEERQAAEMLAVTPTLSNTLVNMIGEREPKYFTVREWGGPQFISISCALGQ